MALEEVRMALALEPHRNIVRCHQAWEEGGYLYIQTELCLKGSLKTFLARSESLSEEKLWEILGFFSSFIFFSFQRKHGITKTRFPSFFFFLLLFCFSRYFIGNE